MCRAQEQMHVIINYDISAMESSIPAEKEMLIPSYPTCTEAVFPSLGVPYMLAKGCFIIHVAV